MPSMLTCVSHSPIIMVRAKAPADEPAILALYAQCAAAIARFDPEQVIIFGSDHFAGFFLSTMPAYCIALAAEAVADVGGFGGKFNVPSEAASALIVHMREAGFDPAISYQMTVDHAFSQPIMRLTGALDRYPVIPIFIGALAPPYMSFARSRAFGAAVGSFIAASAKRTLIIGSGGLSHHPTRYYPLLGEASPEVAAWQLHGERAGTFTSTAWFAKLRDDHLTGADMLISGQRTAEHIRLNADFDRWFMARLGEGDAESLARIPPDEAFEKAGIGSLELHTWIAALAAHQSAGGAPPTQQIYSPTLEYGIGYGMAYSPVP
jgi:2,3-dihydroxyphenylpropionate 1,2-dioxygenase